jgi:hypothetical protein
VLPEASEVRRVAEAFFAERNVLPRSEASVDYPVVYILETARRLFDEQVLRGLEDGTIATGPAWVALRWTVHRGIDHADAGFIAVAAGAAPTAEVISRAVLEVALNLLYIMRGNRNESLYDYLVSYVEQERKELDRWLSLTRSMGAEESLVHLQEIEKKRRALDKYGEVIESFATEAGITRVPGRWPKISERFAQLGDDLGYRVLYAAMSSQAHNDAEDLLNSLALGTRGLPVEAIERSEERLERERLFFARFLLYRGVEYLLKAIARFAQCYALETLLSMADGFQEQMVVLASALIQKDRSDADRFRQDMGRLVSEIVADHTDLGRDEAT